MSDDGMGCGATIVLLILLGIILSVILLII